MTNKEKMLTDKSGQEMSTITFKELIELFTGVDFDKIYKDFLTEDAKNGQKSNVE